MPGEVVTIVGPTRAGKSSLISELMKLICKPIMHGEETEERAHKPAVIVELVNDDSGARFSTRSFILQALEEIDHPIYSSAVDSPWGDAATEARIERAREKTLNRALIRGLKALNTRYLVIDEVQHIKFSGKTTMAAEGVMDALKCIAHKAGVVLVLSGTYPILEAINRSSHLAARMHVVHLPRYHKDKPDLDEFSWILAHYDTELNLDKSMNSLADCTELLFRGSLGCIGLVRAWLYQASVQAAARGVRVNKRIIEETIRTPAQLFAIADEIDAGEKCLGISPCSVLSEALSAKPPKEKRQSAKAIPFQRKAKRWEEGNRSRGEE